MWVVVVILVDVVWLLAVICMVVGCMDFGCGRADFVGYWCR